MVNKLPKLICITYLGWTLVLERSEDFLPPKNGEERCFDLVVKGEDGKTYKFDNVRYDIFVSYLV